MTVEDPREELLVVFVKYPEPGRVKTRLAAGIGERAAADAYRELVATTLESVREWLEADLKHSGPSMSRSVWIYFDPREKENEVRAWLAPLVCEWTSPPQWVAQPSGDLGERLQWVFHQGFEKCFYGICAIGTDCPELSGSGLGRAFAALRLGDGVVGPTTDGGYYLIGLKKMCKGAFCEHTMEFRKNA
jgi:uncharacterized protein